MANNIENFIPGVREFGLSTAQTVLERKNVVASSGNLTPTVAQSGSIFLVDTTTVDFVLPAISTVEVGTQYDFYWTSVSTASAGSSVYTTTGDFFVGAVTIISTGGTANTFAANGTSHLGILTNATTTGGIVGSWLRVVAVNGTQWFVTGVIIGSGSLASPLQTT
jgi:hypothetical protein